MHQDFSQHFTAVAEHINNARNVLILNPEGGDGDSFGSSLALANYLFGIGKNHTVFAKRAARRTFSFLPRFEHIASDPAMLDLASYDLMISVDFADPAMTGIMDILAQRNQEKLPWINIDHHPTNLNFGSINIVDPHSAAACEIMYTLFDRHGWRIDKHIATCLLTGILTDTSNFSNRNTTNRSLEIAARLLLHGARMRRITDFTYRNKTTGALRLWGKVLDRLQPDPETGVMTTFIAQQDLEECRVDDEAASGVANFLNKLEGSGAVLVLRELGDGRVKGSYRTTGDDINVAELAGKYGGGGHRRAAGFTVKGRIANVNGSWRVV